MLYNQVAQVTPFAPALSATDLEVCMNSISARTCDADDCERAPEHRGYCGKHYQQLLKNGVLSVELIYNNHSRRFWSKVNKNGPVHPVLKTPCYLWLSGLNRQGYGKFSVLKKTVPAHRYAYALKNGEIKKTGNPHDASVLHHCDNPTCVNPDHLFLGTSLDNAQDRERKKRGTKRSSEDCNFAKLKPSDVLQIRRLYAAGIYKQADLGRMFGVSRSCVSGVIRRKAWKDI